MKHKIVAQTPVMLGTLTKGSRFIFDSALWEVIEQNWSQERKPDQGRARCKKVNTPVITNICRSNYVMPA